MSTFPKSMDFFYMVGYTVAMNKQRIMILISSAAGIVAGFMPWLTFDFFPAVKGIEGFGKITMGLFSLAFILAASGQRKSTINCKLSYLVLTSGILTVIISLRHLLAKQDAFSLNRMMAEDSTIGVALYIILIAGIMLCAMAALSWRKK